MYPLFSLVALKEDLPGQSFKKGDQGVILEIYEEPEPAYEIEFLNEEGETLDFFAVLADQVVLIEERPH